MRNRWLLLIVMVMFTVLSGCGKDSPEDVRSSIQTKLNDLQSYRTEGVMTIHSPQRQSAYHVKVAFRKPDFYRVELESADQKMRQVVIRNEEGVFLVTPNLNKTFRFQANWPSPQGQVYLYQTLLSAIVADHQGKMTREENSPELHFHVTANYPHRLLTKQNIVLDSKSLFPKRVEVLDDQSRTRIDVQFKTFEENVTLAADSFQVPKLSGTRTVSKLQVKPVAAIFEPAYVPGGVEKFDEQSLQASGRETVIQRYGGSYNYSVWTSTALAESDPVEVRASGLVELGGGFGFLQKNDQLVWWQDGLEYRLVSGDLPVAEMVRVAESLPAWSQKP